MTVPRSPMPSTSLRRIASGTASRPRRGRRGRRGRRDLVLVAPASAGDPPRADLAALGDEPAERADVLVVDVLDLVLAEQARLAAPSAGAALLVAPARGLAV